LFVAQLASTAATARLIAPDAFGAYAAASVAIAIAGYFTISSMGLDILRRSELGPKTVGSAIVLSSLIGALVLAALWFIAPAWAVLWHDRSVARLVRVMAFGLFFASLASVPTTLVRRRLRFAAAAIADAGTQVAGLTLSVVLAVYLHSALALALGQVAIVFSYLFGPQCLPERISASGSTAPKGRRLLTYGTQISGIYIGSYLTTMIPYWIAARSFGMAILGCYSRADRLVNIPLTYLSSSVTKVLFSALRSGSR